MQRLLVVLAFVLPFEMRRPVLSLGPYMVLTLPEVAAIALIVCWAATPGQRFRLLPGGLTVLTGLLVAAFFLSAAAAPDFQFSSFKFALRLLTGVCILHLVAGQGKGRDSVLMAVVAGAALSSAIGILTCALADRVDWVTSLFREREFLIGSTVRLSGTFEYPNIAAAYLEMAFILGLWHAPRGAARGVAWYAVLGVILVGLVMTLSRAGLAAALLGLVLVSVLHALKGGPGYALRRLVPAIGTTALCIAAAAVLYPPVSLRFQSNDDRAWYSAAYQTLDVPEVAAGRTATVRVLLTNTGRISWPDRGRHPYRLSYHWLEAASQQAFPGPQARTELPGEIGPGESATIQAVVVAPSRPGDYILAWDMVQEHVAWFSQKGCPPAKVAFRVREGLGEGQAPDQAAELPPDPAELEIARVSRPTLWKVALGLFARHPILGVGPDNFRRLWGKEVGLDRWDERVHSNNLFLEILVTTGLLGELAFIGLLISVLRLQVRSLRASQDYRGFGTTAALSGAFCVFLLHGTVDAFLSFTSIYVLFWMIAGFSAAAGDLAVEPGHPSALFRPSA